MKSLTTSEFIERAIEVHGNKYNYSLVNYVNNRTKVKIICPIHGEFEQKADSHLRKHGCPSCSNVKPLTTSEFIEKAIKIHGNKYNYFLVDYVNTYTKVKISCPIHGIFEQTPHDHLQNYGCFHCGNIIVSNKKKSNSLEFIEKAIEVHGNKYDYSLVDYINSSTKVKIICHIHGEFEQEANSHLHGSGCPSCSNVKSLTTFEFIERAIKIHGNKYDYSLVDYINTYTKVKIICPIHGEFEQEANSHLRKHGCPSCSNVKILTTSEFIERAIEVHGNKYNYSLVNYVNNKTKVKIICPIHGEFEQNADSHLQGNGCYDCGIIKRSKNKTLTTEQFIEKAIKVHGNKYDYSLVDYVNYYNKVKIICSIHGIFEQTPDNHLHGVNCPKCCNVISSQELKICQFLEENNIQYIQSDRNLITPYELDIIIPEFKLAIEVNGLYWHSELNGNKNKTYHLMKTQLCKEQNIQLLHFFEDEINNKFDIIKNIILAKCNKLSKLCGARNCQIKEIDNKTANDFLSKNHIHGNSIGKIVYIGAFYQNNLVALQSFKQGAISRNNLNNWELDRFCTINNYNISGIASKLFKYFINKYDSINNIITYADLRFSNGNLYNQLGFKFVHQSKPNYFYIINHKRFHRFNFRKSILKNKLENFDPNLTEYQNMLNHGHDRIWDCGHLKYQWNR